MKVVKPRPRQSRRCIIVDSRRLYVWGMKAQCRLPAVPAGTKFSEAGVVQRGAKGKGIRLEKPAAVEAEIFIASAHGALLSARARGAPKMFGEIIRPVLGA